MSDVERIIADGRNLKASKLVALIRQQPKMFRVHSTTVARLEQSYCDELCEQAGVRRASLETWNEVTKILRALEDRDARAAHPAAPTGALALSGSVDRDLMLFALRDFAHRGIAVNLHVVDGDGVARPVFCYLLTVTPMTVDVLVVATRAERAIPVESVRAVVDA